MTGLCQRWKGGRHTWRHRSEGGFNRLRYDVARIPYAEAKAFVTANHYSATMPAPKRCYGLFDGAWLVGVAVLSVPAQKTILPTAFPGLEPYVESAELGRLVLGETVPSNAESWFIARCWELAARDGFRGILSFTDPMPRPTDSGCLLTPGHVGIIYQASNATYLGRGTAGPLLLLPDGRSLNRRALSKVRKDEQGHAYVERMLVGSGARPRRAGESGADWLEHALPAARVREFEHLGNHRFGFRIGPWRKTVVLGLPERKWTDPESGIEVRYPKRPDRLVIAA